jgi:hypothetical protein
VTTQLRPYGEPYRTGAGHQHIHIRFLAPHGPRVYSDSLAP